VSGNTNLRRRRRRRRVGGGGGKPARSYRHRNVVAIRT
jgi:hypothetical protein